MASKLVHIIEERVRELLDWNSVLAAVEQSLVAVTKKRATQTPRTFTRPPGSDDVLLCMPGYLQTDSNGILACKLVTSFNQNENLDPPMSRILANIFLFDDKTGQLKSIIEANEITAWRTAAASVVATKYLHSQRSNRENNILAILGAGTQGRIHAIAFYHFFKFQQIRIWNHRPEKAKKLVEELIKFGIPAQISYTSKECVTNADVIVTATFASSPIVNLNWVKNNVHINAVGAGTNHHSELDESIYRNAMIYVDHMESAGMELKGLEKMQVEIIGEVGELITADKPMPDPAKVTVFHSLGIAAEDAAVGHLIYEKHISTNKI